MDETPSLNSGASQERVIEEVKHFLDVPMKITIQIGTRTMRVRDILQLQPSSVIELEKSAGENVDILVNNRMIGFGEVLELEGCTGIRITDLVVAA